MAMLENLKGLQEGIQKVKDVKRTADQTREQLGNLKDSLDNGMKEGLKQLKLQVKVAMLPKELNNYLQDLNPLVEAFTGLNNLLHNRDMNDGPKTIQDIINKKLFGDDVMDMLANPAAGSVPLTLEQQHPGFLFAMIMTSDVKDPQNIPLNTRIGMSYYGWKTDLVGFIDKNLTIAQVLPDPTITGVKVKLRGTNEEREYKRTFEGTSYVFKDKQNTILQMKDIDSFVVTEKAGDHDRQKLLNQRSVDIGTSITKKLDGDLKDDQYVNPEAGAAVRKHYRAMGENEKVSASGSKAVGCYKTAENLARHDGFDLRSAKPVDRKDSSDQQYNMLTYIPKLIREKNLPAGTVFWIKKDPSIVDPDSTNSAAGNHFFTYVGTVKNGGTEEPYFVDQFGFGNLARMNFSYKQRFFHQAFTPPTA